MNQRVKTGVWFGTGMAVFLIVRSLLNDDIQTLQEVIKSIVAALIAGTLAGLAFGSIVGISRLSKSKASKKGMRI